MKTVALRHLFGLFKAPGRISGKYTANVSFKEWSIAEDEVTAMEKQGSTLIALKEENEKLRELLIGPCDKDGNPWMDAVYDLAEPASRGVKNRYRKELGGLLLRWYALVKAALGLEDKI